MGKPWPVIITVAIPLLLILHYHGCLLTSFLVTMVIGTVGFSFCLGVGSALNSGPRYQVSTHKHPRLAHLLLTKIMEKRNNWQPLNRPVVVSHKVDGVLQQILDLFTRDYVMSWYKVIGRNDEKFKEIIQCDLWIMISKLSDRLGKIDWITLMTQDAVTALYEHFYNIRRAIQRPKDIGPRMKFVLHPYMSMPERELNFLRRISDVLLLYLLPENVKKAKLVRELLREILAVQVFQPSINKLCDADYINQLLYHYFVQQEKLAYEHNRTYTYAATYEDFINMIKVCDDVEHLKKIRYKVITEMMQAATIDNLKKSKSANEKEQSVKGASKGDLLRARNLKRYTNQLRVAKSLCEKRIHILGGPDYMAYDQEMVSKERNQMPGRKILSFSVIMETPVAREYLMKYLHAMDREGLLGYWLAVENMKQSGKRHWHQMAAQIYQMYLASAGSVVRTALDKATVKNMEAFMLGNKGPDAFHEAQDKVYHIIEEKFYPSFILSDTYHKYISLMEEQASQADPEPKVSSKPTKVLSSPVSEEYRLHMEALAKDSTYMHHKVQGLDEKIINKHQALQALRQSKKPDSKMKKLQADLEKEIERLKRERREMEFHGERTDLWTFNAGHWRAQICNSENVEESGRKVPYFAIAVHKSGINPVVTPSGADLTQGWVVTRRLEEFHMLHATLLQINPGIRRFSLPTISILKKSANDVFLEKAKQPLQEFLSAILMDPQLSHCEAVFNFFNQIPEHLKGADHDRQKASALSSFFKRFPSSSHLDSDTDDDLQFGEEGSAKEDAGRDSIAEPLYRLIGEVFELRGVFKWLRRSLIAFVQVTFGRTINRQIGDTVAWVVSEPMVVYYLRTFKDSLWPSGALSEPASPRSDQEKLEMRMLAKDKFLDNIPDALKNLLGEKATKNGAIKVFESLQDPKLNKHIFYTLLEIFLVHLLPELQEFIEQREEERRKTASPCQNVDLELGTSPTNSMDDELASSSETVKEKQGTSFGQSLFSDQEVVSQRSEEVT